VKLLVNFMAFQLGWFSCVLAAAQGIPWLGPIVVAAVVVLHLRLSRKPSAELKLIAFAMLLGLVTDSLLLASGWLDYSAGFWLTSFAPFWIVSMWALFATTLNESMCWLHGRPVLAALMGAVGGPLSYLAGERLGAMTLNQPVQAIAALAVAWSLAMPLLNMMAAKLDRVSKRQLPPYVHDHYQVSSNA